MHDDKRDQFAGELLEAALKQYRGEEPRSGLEMRILAGIRTRQRAARWRGLGWAMAACAGMLAAFVLTLHFIPAPGRQPAPSASLRQSATRSPTPAMAPPQRPGSGARAELVRGPEEKPRTPKAGVRATKRPEQFPTPFPLTEQEKLLLVYLSKATKPDLAVETNERDEAPIGELEISAIKIAPLEIKWLEDSQPEQGK
jgi:hypothetical protein